MKFESPRVRSYFATYMSMPWDCLPEFESLSLLHPTNSEKSPATDDFYSVSQVLETAISCWSYSGEMKSAIDEADQSRNKSTSTIRNIDERAMNCDAIRSLFDGQVGQSSEQIPADLIADIHANVDKILIHYSYGRLFYGKYSDANKQLERWSIVFQHPQLNALSVWIPLFRCYFRMYLGHGNESEPKELLSQIPVNVMPTIAESLCNAICMYLQGVHVFQEDDYIEAESWFQQCKSVLELHPAAGNRPLGQCLLAGIALFDAELALRNQNDKQALSFISESEATYRKIANPLGLASADMLRARVLYKLGRFSRSQSIVRGCVKFFYEARAYHQLEAALSLHGRIENKFANNSTVEDIARFMVQISNTLQTQLTSQTKSPANGTTLRRHLVHAYELFFRSALGRYDFDSAEEYATEVVVKTEFHRDEFLRELGFCYIWRAMLNRKLEQFDHARKCVQVSIQHFEELKRSEERGTDRALGERGVIEILCGEFEMGDYWANRSARRLEEKGYTYEACDVRCIAAEALLARRDYSGSESFLKEAFETGRSVQRVDLTPNALTFEQFETVEAPSPSLDFDLGELWFNELSVRLVALDDLLTIHFEDRESLTNFAVDDFMYFAEFVSWDSLSLFALCRTVVLFREDDQDGIRYLWKTVRERFRDDARIASTASRTLEMAVVPLIPDAGCREKFAIDLADATRDVLGDFRWFKSLRDAVDSMREQAETKHAEARAAWPEERRIELSREIQSLSHSVDDLSDVDGIVERFDIFDDAIKTHVFRNSDFLLLNPSEQHLFDLIARGHHSNLTEIERAFEGGVEYVVLSGKSGGIEAQVYSPNELKDARARLKRKDAYPIVFERVPEIDDIDDEWAVEEKVNSKKLVEFRSDREYDQGNFEDSGTRQLPAWSIPNWVDWTRSDTEVNFDVRDHYPNISIALGEFSGPQPDIQSCSTFDARFDTGNSYTILLKMSILCNSRWSSAHENSQNFVPGWLKPGILPLAGKERPWGRRRLKSVKNCRVVELSAPEAEEHDKPFLHVEDELGQWRSLEVDRQTLNLCKIFAVHDADWMNAFKDKDFKKNHRVAMVGRSIMQLFPLTLVLCGGYRRTKVRYSPIVKEPRRNFFLLEFSFAGQGLPADSLRRVLVAHHGKSVGNMPGLRKSELKGLRRTADRTWQIAFENHDQACSYRDRLIEDLRIHNVSQKSRGCPALTISTPTIRTITEKTMN